MPCSGELVGRHRLAIAIPAYQAAPYLAEVVTRSLVQMPDVLVVDDGSTDPTSDVAREAGAEVVRHRINRGKGSALTTAFEILRARGFEGVVTLDADGQHLPEEIPRLLDGYGDGEADLVLGSRSHLFEEMATIRKMSNRLSSRAISFAAGRPIGDVQTGFRLYGPRLLERVPFVGTGFEAESAIVVRACRAGLQVVSVPIRLGEVDGRRTSHYRPVMDSLRIARSVTMARWR